MDFVSGEKKFSFKEWFKGIGKFVFHELACEWKTIGITYFVDDLQYVFAITTKCI